MYLFIFSDQEDEERMRSFSSSATQELPRATQQSKYSLLGLLPRINLSRLTKPFMTDKNSSMNKVTVKIAPPERLAQTGYETAKKYMLSIICQIDFVFKLSTDRNNININLMQCYLKKIL